ncbi:MAG: hypothetical protein WC521_02600 [Bdellovibrionales bacterium]
MSRGKGTNQRGRSKGEARHIRHYDYELVSPAYRALPCVARALYTEIKRLHNGTNNGQLFLSERMAAQMLGVTQNTARKGFSQLQEKGFIRANCKGAFSWKKRHATTWIITEYPVGDTPPTRDYQKWKPESENQNTDANFKSNSIKK